MRFDLSSEERTTLLKAARSAIREGLDGSRSSPPALTPSLETHCGAFVTLNMGGALRGCVGYLGADRSLYATVISSARSAAFHDSRFSPVTLGEVESIDIEISVLAPSVAIDSWEDIIIGRHGIIMDKDGRSALFLPQVATEYGWDIETTLTHLAKKARIGPDEWRDGATYKVFEALKFGDGVL